MTESHLEEWMDTISLLGDDELDRLLGWMEKIYYSGALPGGLE